MPSEPAVPAQDFTAWVKNVPDLDRVFTYAHDNIQKPEPAPVPQGTPATKEAYLTLTPGGSLEQAVHTDVANVSHKAEHAALLAEFREKKPMRGQFDRAKEKGMTRDM